MLQLCLSVQYAYHTVTRPVNFYGLFRPPNFLEIFMTYAVSIDISGTETAHFLKQDELGKLMYGSVPAVTIIPPQ